MNNKILKEKIMALLADRDTACLSPFAIRLKYLCSLFVLVFLPLTPSSAQIADSISQRWLDEVTVKAERQLYRQKADLMIYDVKADTTLRGKTSYEALRKTPFVIADRIGNIHSVGQWPIEYLVNGAHDQNISGNIFDVLESLDAKYLKRVEVRLERNTDGSEVLKVNFITTGRLQGYRGLARSTVYDDRWVNGAYAFTKRNKLGVSLTYYNHWNWGHKSTGTTEEWRYEQPELYHVKQSSEEAGFKRVMHNIETQLSYEFTPLRILSFYMQAQLKTNPHLLDETDALAETETGELTYAYKKINDRQITRDREYTVSLDYEQLFGENAERGKMYFRYNFFCRPLEVASQNKYTSLEFADASFVNDFYNYTTVNSNTESWHTLLASLRLKRGKHEAYAEDVSRYRDEDDNVDETLAYNFAATPHNEQRAAYYTHRQFSNTLNVGYGYNGDIWQAKAGVSHTYLNDRSETLQQGDGFTFNDHFFTPYADLTLRASRRDRLHLAYTMGSQIPDISALNPYVYTNVPGQISYGNPNLRHQTTHALDLSHNHQRNRLNIYTSASYTYARDLILQHSFLSKEDGLLHITKDNIGTRHELKFGINASSKFTKTSYARLSLDLYHTRYPANRLYAANRGCTFRFDGYLEQELPAGFDLSLSGGYNTPWTFMQGKGGENFHYGANVTKSFPKQRISLTASANQFIPIHYTSRWEYSSPGYFTQQTSRTFHASFQLTLRWRFGKLRAEEHEREEAITHEDIKRDYEE